MKTCSGPFARHRSGLECVLFLKVAESPLHGRGCFATRDLSPGSVVGRAELLVFPPEELAALHQTRLKYYVFYVKDGPVPDGPYFSAVAMGPISFCNHSPDANCDFHVDEAAATVILTARRAVAEGEEVTIDYGDYAQTII